MKRISRAEVSDLLTQFTRWQTPMEMAALYEITIAKIGSVTLFNQAGLAFLRDAWVAAEFGIVRGADQVRLLESDWPDFQMRIDQAVEDFEVTEADDPSRRRGDEYRDRTADVQDYPVEEWIANAEKAPSWIEAACRKKAGKKYPAGANLVVYLNLSEFGIRQSEVEASFRDSTECVRDNFVAVWILWKKKAYKIWSQSEGKDTTLGQAAVRSSFSKKKSA